MNQPKNVWLLATLCLVTAVCLIVAVAALQMWADDESVAESAGPVVVTPDPTPRER